MLSGKQSLILCGVLTGGIFVTGVLKVLNNFIVLTILTLIFAVIMINILFYKSSSQIEENEENN